MTATTSPATARARRPWSLQARLMVTITGIVALILIAVALATSAIIGGILQQNLRNTVAETTSQAARMLTPPFSPVEPKTAFGVLEQGRFQSGFLFVVRNATGALDGAYVDSDDTITALTPSQLTSLAREFERTADGIVSISGLGSYQVTTGSIGDSYLVLGGLPTSEVNATIAQIITTTLLVTSGGLLLLGAAIAVIVRTSLRPLRAVADTATRVAALPLAEGAVSIDERVPDDEADERTEIGRVGAALNTLLDHVDSSLDARQRNEERMRRFVADASHELRTPLSSIRGYSELSLRALRQDAAAAEQTTEQSLERIQAQSLRMTALVEDLLLLARLEEGQELVYDTVDLSRLAIEAVGDAQVADRGHTWRLDVGEDPVLLAGDDARLQQVAANLLANAHTHTPDGTTVTVSVGREGADAVLRVHDDGPGVDPAIRAELFERFARADRSRARKTGGTGLGLSIARAIVLAHGGTISVRSEPGDTTFEVRLHAKPA